MRYFKENELLKLRNDNKLKKTIVVDNTHMASIIITKIKELYNIKVKIKLAKTNTIKTKQKTVENYEVIDALIDSLIRVIIASEKSTFTKKIKYAKHSTFIDLIENVPNVHDVNSFNEYRANHLGKAKIKQSTYDNGLKYLELTVGGMFTKYKRFVVTDEEQKQFIEELIERIYIGDKENGRIITRDKIANGVYGRWEFAREILEFCKATSDILNNTLEIPLIFNKRISSASVELVKVLPYEIFLTVVTFIKLACQDEIQESYGSVGESLSGLRVGESAGLQMGKFEFRGKLGRYYLDCQVGDNGEKMASLKNEYSNRYFYLNTLFVDIYNLKIEQLNKKLNSKKDIEKCYFGSSPNSLFEPISKNRVSKFLKELLILAGCSKKDISLLETNIMGEMGVDSEHELTAHLMRRNFASMARNGGIDMETVDALLGHASKKNVRKEFAGWDNAEEIIGKLNRCFYFGSLTNEKNDSYSERPIKNEEFLIDGSKKVEIEILEDGYIEGIISTVEANASLKITTENNTLINPISMVNVDNYDERILRTVLPNIPSKESVEKIIENAENIWLKSEIRKRYIKENGKK